MPAVPAPRVVGIDDWAWRRGPLYGTLIVDLERNLPVDVLPDREVQTVKAWLSDHPGIDVVARDRAGAYADGVRSGAPEAVQVTDLWHLLRNLGDTLARVLDRHHCDLRAAADTAGEGQDTQPAPDASRHLRLSSILLTGTLSGATGSTTRRRCMARAGRHVALRVPWASTDKPSRVAGA